VNGARICDRSFRRWSRRQRRIAHSIRAGRGYCFPPGRSSGSKGTTGPATCGNFTTWCGDSMRSRRSRSSRRPTLRSGRRPAHRSSRGELRAAAEFAARVNRACGVDDVSIGWLIRVCCPGAASIRWVLGALFLCARHSLTAELNRKRRLGAIGWRGVGRDGDRRRYGWMRPSRMARRLSRTRSLTPSLRIRRYLCPSIDLRERCSLLATIFRLSP
jgi:hypothetical protein